MHLISSLCVSLVLAEQGWREANLGANTPWNQLFLAAKQEQASLVWVSMTAEPNTDYPKKLRELAKELADGSCQIIVGGRQLSDEIARLDLDNLHTARSMVELQSFSKGLLAAYKAMHPLQTAQNGQQNGIHNGSGH